jgi:adenine-specific DNA-methyltransferase
MPARKRSSSKAPRRSRSAGVQAGSPDRARPYTHPDAEQVSRPEVGTQERFRDKKPPRTYRYDSSLAPELQWDGGNAKIRERAEELLRIVETAVTKAAEGDREAAEIAREAARELRGLQEPFLNWSGKAERTQFEVPTLPLFVHERLSTQAILESVRGWKREEQVDLFGDPQRPLAEQLRAYEHRDRWVNRMILGDSLVVMNSLLHYEGMGGQVQMIYIDPPYGVKFGSNFQPFVRRRDVKHNDDADLSREPEMVQAYRDTWEVGLHSYLTYLRDRLLIAHGLLAPSGSVFVQISTENLHHVRELLDEVFGPDNAFPTIAFRKTTGAGSPTGYVEAVPETLDYLLWYARERRVAKLRRVFLSRHIADDPNYRWIEIEGVRRSLSSVESQDDIPTNARLLRPNPLTSQSGGPTTQFTVDFEGRSFTPRKGGWKTNAVGMSRLASARRLMALGNTLCFVRYGDDFPFAPVLDIWDDTRQSGFGEQKVYVVQTSPKVLQRCIQMTTDPGDLVLDPTCGSGTSAYVAEQWGRRWITIDTSRVPLALARQRILTATFPWHRLKDESRGPAGGFVYERKQNARGEETGGLVPHITLKSIANDEPPQMEVLVDRPEQDGGITRVTGPFVVEATIPTPVDWEGDGISDTGVAAAEEHAAFADRMLEVLRRSPTIQLGGNTSVKLEQVRRPAKAMVLNAEAVIAGTTDTAAFVFGPENGAVSESLVHQALKEADRRNYAHLYVVGFAIEPNARQLVETTRGASDVEAWYVQATPDLIMGSLLKTTRASQLFSVCGLPDVEVTPAKKKARGEPDKWTVHLRGVDVFDPSTMESRAVKGSDVPAWFLDTDYNGRVFRVCQAFFPKTGAWDALKRALKAEFDESLFDHLSGDTSAAFEPGEHRTVAVKVIDERGNELLVTRSLA